MVASVRYLMSDMRFTIVGIILVFVGFIVLGVLSQDYRGATIEAEEFGTCYEYSDDLPPVKIDCVFRVADQVLFFGAVMGLIGAGIVSLVKGARGDWDNRVRPEDMVGPSSGHDDDDDTDDGTDDGTGRSSTLSDSTDVAKKQ